VGRDLLEAFHSADREVPYRKDPARERGKGQSGAALPGAEVVHRSAELKTVWRDRTSHFLFEPIEFLEKLAAIVFWTRPHRDAFSSTRNGTMFVVDGNAST